MKYKPRNTNEEWVHDLVTQLLSTREAVEICKDKVADVIDETVDGIMSENLADCLFLLCPNSDGMPEVSFSIGRTSTKEKPEIEDSFWGQISLEELLHEGISQLDESKHASAFLAVLDAAVIECRDMLNETREDEAKWAADHPA